MMNKKNILPVLIVLTALGLMIFSVKGDSVTTDESPHIAAGYSYLTQSDMRLNPEHPPLIKDLAALPLLFQKINFDAEHYSWKNSVNGQWTFGTHFLYESGNNPDKIAFAARISVMLIFVLLAVLVYRFALAKYGRGAALTALFLTAFSPNILAHARYVTTDAGAAFAFLLAIYFFIKFLENPSKKNLLWAGLAFGVAQLIKFSLFLLVPLYVFVFIVFWLVKHPVFNIKRSLSSLLAIFIVGYALIWPVYRFHVQNYPTERQTHDTEFILNSHPFKPGVKAVLWMAKKPLFRPYAQYFTGLMMVFERAGGGNTTYFMGEASSTAWKSYFPVVYVLKEPIPVLILILIAFTIVLYSIVVNRRSWREKIKSFVLNHTAEFVSVSFIILYWLTSIFGNLNIGLRHVLPTFPFIYLLTAGALKKWASKNGLMSMRSARVSLIAAMMFWLGVETAGAYPHYLAYFNEFAGGPANGYKYVADSNLDWGQDLKRLTEYVEKNKIEKIKLDYFGGGNPQYYLGEKYEKLDANNISQRQGWLAVSATLLQGGRAMPTKGFDKDTSYYHWLDAYKPVTQIGYSIFVYYID